MPKPPLGVVQALASGFETVNARLELAVLPLALDLFLWLGPRLSIQPFMRWLAQWLAMSGDLPGIDPAQAQQTQAVQAQLVELGNGYNLFSLLSTMPIGLPSVKAVKLLGALFFDSAGGGLTAMGRRLTEGSPLGALPVWPLSNPLAYLVWPIGLTLAGLFLGAVYFGGIAQQVRQARLHWSSLFKEIWWPWLNLTALLLLGLVLIGAIGAPLVLLGGGMQMASSVVGQSALGGVLELGAVAVIFFSGLLLIWCIFYASFAPQGIVLKRRWVGGAIWDSVRIIQWSFPATFGLYVCIYLINTGFGVLWNLPAANSWLTLVALLGHAFVSTALVAATFAYYQDRHRWWAEMRLVLKQRIKAGL